MKKELIERGRSLFLAYDQGLEHGPEDFNDKNVNPKYIMDIAKKGNYNGIIFQKGIAEKYYDKKSGIPLILKLNGKTKLLQGEPYSPVICSVKEAKQLGAKAVGYTIYVGSQHEARMFNDFMKIEEEARKYKMKVIVWAYPRGKVVKNEFDRKIMAYSARVALELGADMVKMKYNGKPKDLKWMVESAGKCRLLIAGGTKSDPKKLFKQIREFMDNGAQGMAVGRNVWQHKEPLKMTKALKALIFNHATPEEALRLL